MARITPDGISHRGKSIGWAEIDRINIITNELAGGTTDVWAKSKDFTGTIHVSLQEAERVKAIITQNLAPERISHDAFSPSYLAFVRVRDVLIRVVWLALIVAIAVYILRYHPSPRDLFHGATYIAAASGPFASLIFLLGVHQVLFIKEYWAGSYRRWRFFYLRVDAPEKIAFDHGVILATAGAITLLLALAAGEWQGPLGSVLGLVVLLAIKRYSPARLRDALVGLTLVVLFVSLLAARMICG